MSGFRDGGARERRFVVTFGSLVSRLGAPIIALSLTFASLFAAAHAAENARKVTVVSFGLYGDQGVFAARRLARHRSWRADLEEARPS